jgi:hypothetical protein
VLRAGRYPRQVAPQEQFVYHQLASDFRGTVLYPLNHLATVYPDIHAREAPKYAGREGVMSYRVPHLDAPWADTVNLSTLDPRLLVAARERLGIASSQLLRRTWMALASCPARQGQQRSFRRMRQVLSWAIARSPGARSFAWARLASFCDSALFLPR